MHDHLAHGVSDLRVAMLPARYGDLLLATATGWAGLAVAPDGFWAHSAELD